jgi:hypothetical protein
MARSAVKERDKERRGQHDMTQRRLFSVGIAALGILCVGLTVQPALRAASVTTTSVSDFPEGPVSPGSSSTLVRNDTGVSATFLVSGLNPGVVYTFWWLVFNEPENCSPPACNLDDVVPFPGNSAAGVSLLFGAGQVIGNSGSGHYGARLAVGDTTGAFFGPGLVDPLGAEIHIVLRSHGPVVDGMVDEQLTSFNGGCPPNTCANVLAAQHKPFTDDATAQLDSIEAQLTATKSLLDRLARSLSINP